jgi:hypothetical protein
MLIYEAKGKYVYFLKAAGRFRDLGKHASELALDPPALNMASDVI